MRFFIFILTFFAINFCALANFSALSEQEMELLLAKDPKDLFQKLSANEDYFSSPESLPLKYKALALSDSFQERNAIYKIEALYYLDEKDQLISSLDCASHFNNPIFNLRLQSIHAHMLMLLSQNEAALACINKALKHIDESRLSNWQEVEAYAIKAHILINLGKAKDSQSWLKKQERYALFLPNNFRKAQILEINSAILKSTRAYVQAIEYQKKAIDIYLASQLNNHLSVAYFNLSEGYISQEKFLPAKKASTNSLKYAKLTDNLLNTLYSTEQLSRVALKSGDYQAGFSTLESIVNTTDFSKMPIMKVQLLVTLGRLADKLAQPDKMLDIYLQAIALSEQNNFSNKTIEQLRFKAAELLAKQKKYKQAYWLIKPLAPQ